LLVGVQLELFSDAWSGVDVGGEGARVATNAVATRRRVGAVRWHPLGRRWARQPSQTAAVVQSRVSGRLSFRGGTIA
jgi:hypothetical protein